MDACRAFVPCELAPTAAGGCRRQRGHIRGCSAPSSGAAAGAAAAGGLAAPLSAGTAAGLLLAAGGLAGSALRGGRRAGRRRGWRPSAVARAAGWRSASAGGGASAAELVSALPAGGAAGDGGAALLLVPRARAAELPALAAGAEGSLGPGVRVVAALTGAERLQLAVAPGGASASLGAATLAQDLDGLAAAAAGATALLLLADPSAPPAALGGAWSGLEARFPGAAKAGAVVAPPAAKGQPGLAGLAGSLHPGGMAVVALGAPARAAMDACGYEPFGQELEVFEAAVPRSGPCVVAKIGTDKAGSWDDVEETEKGTAGIARRVSIPAARAVQDAMKEAGVGGPKEVLFGVPGAPASGATPVQTAEGKTWSLFPWAGMNKDGSVVLGGKGPVAEGLCPKGSLSCIRCFRPVIGPETATMQMASGASAGALALASAGAPPGALKDLLGRCGPGALVLVGSSLIGAVAGAASPVQGRAVGLVAP